LIGICLTKTNIIDETCSTGNESLYYCNDISSSCISNINICDPKSNNISNSCKFIYNYTKK